MATTRIRDVMFSTKNHCKGLWGWCQDMSCGVVFETQLDNNCEPPGRIANDDVRYHLISVDDKDIRSMYTAIMLVCFFFF